MGLTRKVRAPLDMHPDLPPQGGMFNTIRLTTEDCFSQLTMTAPQAAAFQESKIGLEVIGGVIYSDPFGIPHETQFCSVVLGPGEGERYCHEHNTMR